MDVLTLIFIIVITIMLFAFNIIILAYYCHPDDKGFGSSLICKIFIVIGLTLSWAQVLMLPLDVSNNRSFSGGINMQLFWYIVYISTAIMVTFILPALTAYYESDPDDNCITKLKTTFCSFISIAFAVSLILIMCYMLMGVAEVPITSINCSINVYSYSDVVISDNNVNEYKNKCSIQNDIIEIKVSFIIYTIALMSFISWFLFVIYGGIGLAALPLDTFRAFHARPKLTKGIEITERKRQLVEDCEDLRQLTLDVKRMEEAHYDKKYFWTKEKRQYNKSFNFIKAGIAIIEQEYNYLNFANQVLNDTNGCVLISYYLLIPFAILFLILSLLWVIQIMLSFIVISHNRPIINFLSAMLLALQDNHLAFLSFVFFSVFCLYLLFATMKGNVKFGMRFFMCMAVHPMKKDQTYMNSFLFNVCLLLLCSVSITQFCNNAFNDYVAFTDIDLIFSVQIKYLKFFKYFYAYHVFEYLLLGMFGVSCVYLIVKPVDKVTTEKMFREKEKEEMKYLEDQAKVKKKEEEIMRKERKKQLDISQSSDRSSIEMKNV